MVRTKQKDAANQSHQPASRRRSGQRGQCKFSQLKFDQVL